MVNNTTRYKVRAFYYLKHAALDYNTLSFGLVLFLFECVSIERALI
jgi:hypothetical protein